MLHFLLIDYSTYVREALAERVRPRWRSLVQIPSALGSLPSLTDPSSTPWLRQFSTCLATVSEFRLCDSFPPATHRTRSRSFTMSLLTARRYTTFGSAWIAPEHPRHPRANRPSRSQLLRSSGSMNCTTSPPPHRPSPSRLPSCAPRPPQPGLTPSLRCSQLRKELPRSDAAPLAHHRRRTQRRVALHLPRYVCDKRPIVAAVVLSRLIGRRS